MERQYFPTLPHLTSLDTTTSRVKSHNDNERLVSECKGSLGKRKIASYSYSRDEQMTAGFSTPNRLSTASSHYHHHPASANHRPGSLWRHTTPPNSRKAHVRRVSRPANSGAGFPWRHRAPRQSTLNPLLTSPSLGQSGRVFTAIRVII